MEPLDSKRSGLSPRVAKYNRLTDIHHDHPSLPYGPA